MKEWTREERYRVLKGPEDIRDLYERSYQWCPWGAVHGLKYWYHVTSGDLIHWQNAGIGPDFLSWKEYRRVKRASEQGILGKEKDHCCSDKDREARRLLKSSWRI